MEEDDYDDDILPQFLDAPGNDGKASMPEQVKRSYPRGKKKKKMMMMMMMCLQFCLRIQIFSHLMEMHECNVYCK